MSTDKRLRRAMNSATNRKQLKAFRKQAGLSQAELASLAGVGQQMVSRFEKGERDLSPAALSRLVEVITDFRDGKMAAKQVAELRRVKLSSLVGGKITEDAFKESSPLSSLVGPFRPQTNEEKIQQLEELAKSQDQLIKGYQKMNKINDQIIALLKEADAGKTAAENLILLEQVEKLRAENAELREWLNAEEAAAMAHGKAAELRERVNSLTVAGMRKENAEED